MVVEIEIRNWSTSLQDGVAPKFGFTWKGVGCKLLLCSPSPVPSALSCGTRKTARCLGAQPPQLVPWFEKHEVRQGVDHLDLLVTHQFDGFVIYQFVDGRFNLLLQVSQSPLFDCTDGQDLIQCE